jgi:hypothetical protein
VSYRSSSGNSGSGSSLVVTAPAGIQNGDTLIAIWINGGFDGATITWPSGFTQIGTLAVNPAGQTFKVARKIASSESGDYTISSNVSDFCAAIVAVYSGRSTDAPVVQTTMQSTTAETPVSAALSGVTAAAGDDILWICAQNGASGQWTHSPPTSYTERQERSPGSWVSVSLADRENVSAGATGTLTGTLTRAGAQETGYAGFVIALASSGGGGGRSITSINDVTLTHGQTGIVVGVSGYAATGKTVKICPTDNVNDASGVAQTVTAQDASSVTFTAVLNSFAFGATLYVFVLDGGVAANSNADGEPVSRIVASATLNFTGTNKFIKKDGTPAANLTNHTFYIWRAPRPPSSGGTPDQIITGVSTNASGERSQGINLGSLDHDDTVSAALFGPDGTDSYWLGEVLPTYA